MKKVSSIKNELLNLGVFVDNATIMSVYTGGIEKTFRYDNKGKGTEKSEYKEDFYTYYINAHKIFSSIGDLIIVDIYDLGTINRMLKYRIFCNKVSFITYDCVERKFTNKMVCRLINYFYPYYRQERAKCSQETFSLLKEFLCNYSATVTAIIIKYQEEIRKTELEIKHKKITDKIDMDLVDVPQEPQGLAAWCDKAVFLENRYMVYTRVGSKIKGTCSYCGGTATYSKAKHNSYAICLHCKSKVNMMSAGIVRDENIFKEFAVIQKIANGLIIRVYDAVKEFRQKYSISEIRMKEIMRTTVRGNEFKNYYWDTFRDTGVFRWCDRCKSAAYKIHTTTVYGKNLKQVLKDTPFKYCGIEEYANNLKRVNVANFMQSYLNRPEIEQLVKVGLYNVVNSAINNNSWDGISSGANIKQILGINKETLALARQIDAKMSDINFIQTCLDMNMQLQIDDLLFFKSIAESYYSRRAYANLLNILRYTVPEKLRSYLEMQHDIKKAAEQQKSCSYGYSSAPGILESIIKDYNDYIIECEKLNLNLKSKNILFPINLSEAHEKTSKMIKNIANEAKRLYFNKIGDRFKKLNFMDEEKGLCIQIAQSMESIIAEGKALSHCVGGYADKMADGYTLIFFIRKTDDKDTPYYTLELDPEDYRVQQYRGFANNRKIPVDPSVTKFVDKWKQHVKKMKRKIAAAVA